MGSNHQGIPSQIRSPDLALCALVTTDDEGPTARCSRSQGGPTLPGHILYGRRIQIPSSVQVRHELRAFIAEENVRELCAEADGLPVRATWTEIEARRGVLKDALV